MKKCTLLLALMIMIVMSVFAQNNVFWRSDSSSIPVDTSMIRLVAVADNNTNDQAENTISGGDKIMDGHSATGNSECATQKNTVSSTPNPANQEISFNYSLVPCSISKITILQITGTVISEIPIHGTNGNATLDTRELRDGLYFYYLMVDGKVCSAKKFVVRH